jgi:GT2 family glycosyltransferase
VLDLSIIIVSYNTKDLLRECLSAVYRTVQDLSFEVFVVDNSSTDGSIDMVQAEFAEVQVVANKENLGFAKATNQALRIVQGEFLLLLNSDAFLMGGTVRQLVDMMRRDSRVALASPRILNPDGSLQGAGGGVFPSVRVAFLRLFRLPRILPRAALQRIFPDLFRSDRGTRAVDTMLGCCLLLRNAACVRIGLLDEDFFMYGVGMEWSWRARRNGYITMHVAEAEVTHLNESSYAPHRRLLRIAGRSKFYEKTGALWRGLIICAIDIVYYATVNASAVLRSIFSHGANRRMTFYSDKFEDELLLLKHIVKALWGTKGRS